MIVSGHQPDLLPYSGFWFKMATCDVFDLKVYDQFQAAGYQRRVLMRGTWASVPVVGNPRRARILDVEVMPRTAREALANLVVGRYRGSPHWADRGPALVRLIERDHATYLWQFNLHLILGVREMLGIGTPIAIAPPPTARKSEGLVQVVRRYGADTYLSGTGGKVYMGDCHEFDEAGIEVRFSEHAATTADSIVTLLMDHDDPLAAVMSTHAPVRADAATAGAPA